MKVTSLVIVGFFGVFFPSPKLLMVSIDIDIGLMHFILLYITVPTAHRQQGTEVNDNVLRFNGALRQRPRIVLSWLNLIIIYRGVNLRLFQ